MQRAKLGDVYYIKLPNGYKLYQWAYRIPKWGDYIRVFEGLYDAIPDDVSAIVAGPHSYVIGFFASRAYRIGLAQLIGNYPVPEEYPFPDFRLKFWMNQNQEIISIWITPNGNHPIVGSNIMHFPVSSMCELPEEYRNLKLLSSVVTPDWLLYLFDYNFNLSDLRRYYPEVVLGEKWKDKLSEYRKMVDSALLPIKDNQTRKSNNK